MIVMISASVYHLTRGEVDSAASTVVLLAMATFVAYHAMARRANPTSARHLAPWWRPVPYRDVLDRVARCFDYSTLNALTGSTLAARQAGVRLAIAATTDRSTAAATSV